MNKKNLLFKLWIYFSGILIISVTLGIFIFLLYKGVGVISLDFLFSSPKGIVLGTEGGIFPAIVGSLLSGLLSGLMGGFLGLCTAIYLAFYCKSLKLKSYMINALQCLAGIPSVTLGLFGYSFLIVGFGLRKSLLSVSLTLNIMIVPYLSIRIMKALEESSTDQMICSLSLGISKSYTITKLIIPSALKYIMTSLGLSIVFAMGATAPVMFTGAVIMAGVPSKLSDPIMVLPYHLYMLISEGLSVEMAYGTAFVLIVIVLLINIVCRYIGEYKGSAK